jgi:hypothetical protein
MFHQLSKIKLGLSPTPWVSAEHVAVVGHPRPQVPRAGFRMAGARWSLAASGHGQSWARGVGGGRGAASAQAGNGRMVSPPPSRCSMECQQEVDGGKVTIF